MVVNDGDLRIWSSLGKNVFISIPLVIFLGSPGPMVGSVDRESVFSGHPLLTLLVTL